MWASGLTARERTVIELLACGLSRAAAAALAYVSVRSVDRILADMKNGLGTTDAFVLGSLAVRSRVARAYKVLEVCAVYRAADDWVKPTIRQANIIRMLAQGMPASAVAGELGVSPRTVRRDLSAFATANGARTAMAAGALCEALGL